MTDSTDPYSDPKVVEALAKFPEDPLTTVAKRSSAVTQEGARYFLALIDAGYTVDSASRAAGFTGEAFYQIAKRDPKFNEAWELAKLGNIKVVEDAAMQRAVEGVKKAVWYKGEIVGYETVYSDRLLEVIMKARKPESYGDKQQLTIDATARQGNTLMPATFDDLSADDRHALAQYASAVILGEPAETPRPELLERLDAALPAQAIAQQVEQMEPDELHRLLDSPDDGGVNYVS